MNCKSLKVKQDLQKPQVRSPSASTAGKPRFWKTPLLLEIPPGTSPKARAFTTAEPQELTSRPNAHRSSREPRAHCRAVTPGCPPPSHLGPGVAPDLRHCRSSASHFPHLQNGNNSFPQLQRSLCSLNISKACGRIYNYPKNHCEFSLLFQHLH